tara:strand:- start:40 stop:1713 length:1674 start_codon:yes stop_codon:yes gene_type:complete
MAIFDNIKKLFKPNKKVQTKQYPTTMFNTINYTQGKNYTYEDLVKEGYENNAIAYRCINEISQGASGVKLKLFRGKMNVENHPLLDLLERPSPNKGYVELFESLYSFLLLSGNSYLIGSGAEKELPSELYCLRPDRIRIIPGEMSLPLAYQYLVNGKLVAEYPVDQTTGLSSVKHFKLFHPKHDHLGMSPLVSAASNVDSHNLTNKHNVALLQNGARPSGAVVFKPKDETGSTVQLSESQRAQIIQDMEYRFSGAGNAGRPMLLEGDFHFQQMGLSPKDMDFSVLKKMSAIDIALCFGVPAQLVGIPDAQTYNNMPEARLALYEETIIPILRRIQSDLNEWLTPQFGDGMKLEYDIDSIPAMAESRKRVFESVIQGVNSGILTRNEAREKLGFDPIKGGDTLFVPASVMPISLAGESVGDDEDEKLPEDSDDYPDKKPKKPKPDEEEDEEEDDDKKQILTEEIVKEKLKEIIKEHNANYSEDSRQINIEMLNSVYKRAIEIYNKDRQSIKIPITSEEQWGFARVNAFIFAVRTGKFRGGKFDMDLLPIGHTLRSADG